MKPYKLTVIERVGLEPFKFNGRELQVIGTHKTAPETYEHEVRDNETREVKMKSDEWLQKVCEKVLALR